MSNLSGKGGIWGTRVYVLCCDSDSLYFGMITSFRGVSFDKLSVGSSSCSSIITFGVVFVMG
jgi:hypothetical protein